MNHLSDQQFEDILSGTAAEPPHLAQCPHCQSRLAKHRALRQRLQTAFNTIAAPDDLARRIHTHLTRPRRYALWPALAAAAAILAVAIPLAMYFGPAQSAQAELARIHTHNVTHQDIYSDADPAKLAEYLKTQLGFTPAHPRLDQGMAIRGCCISHFRGRIVGSYVVDTSKGAISLIVVKDDPDLFRTGQKRQHNGRTLWASSFAKCNMITVVLDGRAYCAVGEVPQETLTNLITLLLPEKLDQAK